MMTATPEVSLHGTPAHALLIEDDRKLAGLLTEFLGRHGVQVTQSEEGSHALDLLAREAFDIILLDLTLPGMDGLEVARRIREHWSTPIIMITARGDEADRIVGLELAADDYLAKPFNPRELLARMRAVVRRVQVGTNDEHFASGGLTIEFASREVLVEGRRPDLTTLEFELLAALARHAGRVLSRERLLDLTKGQDADEAFDRSIDVHVSRLRQKIEQDPRHPRFLKTVRGAGYLLAKG